jgi:hypothetical protein
MFYGISKILSTVNILQDPKDTNGGWNKYMIVAVELDSGQ